MPLATTQPFHDASEPTTSVCRGSIMKLFSILPPFRDKRHAVGCYVVSPCFDHRLRGVDATYVFFANHRLVAHGAYLSDSSSHLFNQAHFGAGHQLVNVDKYEHALVKCAETDQIVSVERRTHFRSGLDLIG